MSLTTSLLGGRRPRPERTDCGRPPGPQATASAPLGVAEVVAVNRLLWCLERNRRMGGGAPGPDGLAYRDFGRQEASRAFERLRASVLGRTYPPPAPRIVRIPKKQRGTYRELSVFNVADRALATSVSLALGPVFAPRVSDLTHSFGGKGVCSLLAELAAGFEPGGYGAMLNLDVRAAFPSVPLNRMMAALAQSVRDEHLLWLVGVLLRGELGNTLGIPQGLALSPLLLDLYMSGGFDRHWSRHPGMPLLLRYVDNVPCLVGSVDEGREVLARCHSLLGDLGLALKDQPEGELLIDLRSGGTTELLGFEVSLDGKSLRYGITGDAVTSLEQSLREAHDEPNPSLAAEAVVSGWISAMGPALDHSQRNALLKSVTSIAKRLGFRELSQDSMRGAWTRSRQRWEQSLQTARGKAQEMTHRA